jgi:hypothetical protein
MAGEQARHFRGRLEMAVGEALAPETRVVDGDALANARHDVLQDPALRHVVQHVAGRDRWHARRLRQVGEFAQPHGIARPAAQGERQVAPVAEILPQAIQANGKPGVGRVGNQDRQQPLTMGHQVLPAEVALPLPRSPFAEREQPAKLRVGRAIGRIDEQRRAIAQIEAAAQDQAHPGLRGLLVRTHNAGQRIAVGDAERRQPEQLGLGEQLLDMRSPAQEREVRRHLELGVAGHGLPSSACSSCDNPSRHGSPCPRP